MNIIGFAKSLFSNLLILYSHSILVILSILLNPCENGGILYGKKKRR